MPDSSDDERDSRTAAVGFPRSHSNSSAAASRNSPKDRAARKKSRDASNKRKKDLQDLVPRGGTFSATPLIVDPDDATSSSGSDSSDSENDSADDHKIPARNNAPAINWNQGSRSAIRTSLAGRSTPSGPSQTKSAFDAVNDKYFRSRSASVSSDEEQELAPARNSSEHNNENGQSKTYFVDDSDGSESGEVSEGGESMMLNIGQQRTGSDLAETQLDGSADSQPLFTLDTSPDPAYASLNTPLGKVVGLKDNSELEDDDGNTTQDSNLQLPPQSKAEAFAEFATKYKTAPTVLADLNHKDLEIQARHFFIDRSIHDLDLSMPISCTECLQEGHLALVCPSRECQYCGAWNLHEDRLCPTVRRCQKCREVGHDSHDCQSLLKSSAAETPCDYCGADTHTEYDCDKMWKFPRLQPIKGPIKVSISCSYCTNKNHLLGDCPLKKIPSTSSTFSLKPYTPSEITNLNVVIGPRKANQTGMQIRGRANNFQSMPPQDDDNTLALHAPRAPQRPQGGRGKIQFQSGIGQDRNFGGEGPPPLPREPLPPRPPPFQPRDYRDRDQGHHPRQRSRSPRHSPNPPMKRNRRPAPPWLGRGRGRGRDQYRPDRP